MRTLCAARAVFLIKSVILLRKVSRLCAIIGYTESSGSFKFLHKDYLGSVLAVTDEAGTKLEQRHFDAWGQLTHLKIGSNATVTDKEQIRNYLSDGNLIVDRGYTSHSLSRPQTGSILPRLA